MTKPHPIAGIILAAGTSQRMGYPKQLIRIKKRPLVEIVVSAALASNLDRIILVLGHRHDSITPHLAHLPQTSRFKIVVNTHYKQGLSHSLYTGLCEVEKTHPAVMFLLGDQPLITANAINFIISAFWRSSKNICLPVHGQDRGNPTIFGRCYYDAIKQLKGDTGARDIIQANWADVRRISTKNPAYFIDIDTPSDFFQLIEPAK